MKEVVETATSSLSFDELTKIVKRLTDAHDIKLFYSLKKLDKQFDNSYILMLANSLFLK